MNRPHALIVLSPHFDDAALSCGGRLAAASAAGGRTAIVTAFASAETHQLATPMTAALEKLWRLSAREIHDVRVAEDLESCRRLGAEPIHWPLDDARYRVGRDGRPVYSRFEDLYGAPSSEDEEFVALVAERIRALPPTELLLAPLGVGGHVDHLLVRRAAARSGRAVAHYEDFPYSEWKWFAVRQALRDARGAVSESLPLGPELLERKVAGILAHRSQVELLFRSEGRLRKQLRRAARRAGGERIWRFAPPAATAR